MPSPASSERRTPLSMLTGHVELQDLTELGQIHLVERPVQAGAGVVHQPVDPLMPVDRGVQQACGGRAERLTLSLGNDLAEPLHCH
jgi:hypothetical protein